MKAACLGNLFGLLGLVTVTAWCGTAEAATLILGASAQSRYDAQGTDFFFENPGQTSPIGNTLTGLRDGLEYRSYFIFDVSSIAQPVNGARLRLLNKRYYSTETSETIALFDVKTSVFDLLGRSERIDTYDDLGTGAAYGTAVIQVNNPPQNDFDNVVEAYFEVTLTPAAINDINQTKATGGRYFAIGVKLADESMGSPYTFTTAPLTGLQVEGAVFSGGFRDPLADSEVPGKLILDLEAPPPPPPPVGVSEPSAALSVLVLGASGGILKRIRGSRS